MRCAPAVPCEAVAVSCPAAYSAATGYSCPALDCWAAPAIPLAANSSEEGRISREERVGTPVTWGWRARAPESARTGPSSSKESIESGPPSSRNASRMVSRWGLRSCATTWPSKRNKTRSAKAAASGS